MRIRIQEYYVYILTNRAKTTLYTGVTNDLEARSIEHWQNRGNKKSFTGRYCCYNLLYFEKFSDIETAIAREKQIKGWVRAKKKTLIESANPSWQFLNAEICGIWPPGEIIERF